MLRTASLRTTSLAGRPSGADGRHDMGFIDRFDVAHELFARAQFDPAHANNSSRLRHNGLATCLRRPQAWRP